MTCVNSHGNAIVKWLEEDRFFHISRKKKYCDEMGQSHRLPIWDRSIFAADQGKRNRSTEGTEWSKIMQEDGNGGLDTRELGSFF